jgi:hypothetical protein
MESLFFACSELSAIDIQTQKISLFNLFEEIHSVSYPVFIQSLSLAISLEKDRTDEDTNKILFRVSIGEDEIFKIESDILFSQRKRARALTVINGLIVPRPGVLCVSAHHKKKRLAQWNIVLNLIEAPQPVLSLPSPSATASRRKK